MLHLINQYIPHMEGVEMVFHYPPQDQWRRISLIQYNLQLNLEHISKLLDCVTMQGDRRAGAHFSRDFLQKAPFARAWRGTGVQPGRLSLCQGDIPSQNRTPQQSQKGNFNFIFHRSMTQKDINGLRFDHLFLQMTWTGFS